MNRCGIQGKTLDWFKSYLTNYNGAQLKEHSQPGDRADLDTTFAGLKRVYLNPKSNVRVGYI